MTQDPRSADELDQDWSALVFVADWERGPDAQDYQELSDWLDSELRLLEDKFRSFCTPNSIAASLHRS